MKKILIFCFLLVCNTVVVAADQCGQQKMAVTSFRGPHGENFWVYDDGSIRLKPERELVGWERFQEKTNKEVDTRPLAERQKLMSEASSTFRPNGFDIIQIKITKSAYKNFWQCLKSCSIAKAVATKEFDPILKDCEKRCRREFVHFLKSVVRDSDE